MKKLILLLFLFAFCAGVGKGVYYLKDGFSTRRIHSLENWITPDWDEEAELALDQPFYYLGRGRQCFAFASKDQKYVLKLPRTDIYRTPFWARILPVKHYRDQLEVQHLHRQNFVLGSFDISFHELRNQTGILAVHLGQSSPQGKKITLIDKLGTKHSLPRNKTPFVLQYKKPILMKEFSLALQQGNKKQAEKILDAMIDVIVERAGKGILNRDRSFLRNYGFDGEKGYQIDVGSFFRDPKFEGKAAYEKSIRDSVDPVLEWLAKTDPEMLDYLRKKLDALLI